MLTQEERIEMVKQGNTAIANMRTDKVLIEWARNNNLFVKVDRGTLWGNPFKESEYGRDVCCDKYDEYINNTKWVESRIHKLKGKVLGCWCYPKRCHSESLIRILEKTSG